MLKIFKIISICMTICICLTGLNTYGYAQRLTEYQETEKALPTAVKAQEAPLVDETKQALRLCVLDNTPPYMFFDSSNTRHGYDMDLWEAMNLPYTPEFISTDMATALVMLNNDGCQMLLSSTLITQELKKRFLFSEAHLQSDLHALVLKESPLQHNEILSSSIVGVVKGTSAEKYAFEELKESTIFALKTGPEVFALLLQGQVEALIGHKVNLQALVDHYDEVHMLNPTLQKQYFGFVFSKKNESLAHEVSQALDKLEYEGTLFEIYNKWFAKRILQILNDE